MLADHVIKRSRLFIYKFHIFCLFFKFEISCALSPVLKVQMGYKDSYTFKQNVGAFKIVAEERKSNQTTGININE